MDDTKITVIKSGFLIFTIFNLSSAAKISDFREAIETSFRAPKIEADKSTKIYDFCARKM